MLGCAGINAVDGALSGLAQPGNYETPTEGTRFEADASEVSAIEVNWLAGSGQVRVAPDSETGGKVVVEETVRGGSCPVMVCEVEDGTLSVSYMEGHGGLSGCSQSWFGQKDLTVTVPASLGEKLELFGLEAASGRYTVENLNCGELELGVASGEVDMTGLAAKCAELSVASGRVHVQGAITENIGLDQASGDVSLSLPDAAPAEVTGSMASGSLTLELPADTQLAAEVDKTSGNFNNEFANQGNGNGKPCSLSFAMISGAFTVRPAA